MDNLQRKADHIQHLIESAENAGIKTVVICQEERIVFPKVFVFKKEDITSEQADLLIELWEQGYVVGSMD